MKPDIGAVEDALASLRAVHERIAERESELAVHAIALIETWQRCGDELQRLRAEAKEKADVLWNVIQDQAAYPARNKALEEVSKTVRSMGHW